MLMKLKGAINSGADCVFNAPWDNICHISEIVLEQMFSKDPLFVLHGEVDFSF